MFYNVTLTEDEYYKLIRALDNRAIFSVVGNRERKMSAEQMEKRLLEVINKDKVAYGTDMYENECFIWTGESEDAIVVAKDSATMNVHDEMFYDLEEYDQLAIYNSVMEAERRYNEMF